jgi:hypothetical protein
MRRTQRRCQYYYAMRTVPNLFTLITYVMTRCLDKWTNVLTSVSTKLIFMADTLASPVSTWKAQTQRNPAVSTLHPFPAHSPRCGEFAKPCQSASARCDTPVARTSVVAYILEWREQDGSSSAVRTWRTWKMLTVLCPLYRRHSFKTRVLGSGATGRQANKFSINLDCP